MSELPCQAPGTRGLAGLAGSRCGKPAVYRTKLGQVVCEACGQRMKKDHEEGVTILSMLRPGPFPLEPIQ
jgi:uncharacterized protein (DUF983 family)